MTHKWYFVSHKFRQARARGQVNFLQSLAPAESSRADGYFTFREINLFQGGTSTEYVHVDSLSGVGQRDRCQNVRTGEPIGDVRDTFADNQLVNDGLVSGITKWRISRYWGAVDGQNDAVFLGICERVRPILVRFILFIFCIFFVNEMLCNCSRDGRRR